MIDGRENMQVTTASSDFIMNPKISNYQAILKESTNKQSTFGISASIIRNKTRKKLKKLNYIFSY